MTKPEENSRPAARDQPAYGRQADAQPTPAAPAGKPPATQPAKAPDRPAGPRLARPSAVLDEAHLGDIEGALGRIKVDAADARGFRRKLITFLAIVGPGLIVMVGDNDAGGVSTYAQAGQNYGYSLLWTLLLLIPVLIVNQEMVVRLGAVTGVGHARLINERFGRFWGWFSVGDLFILNFLTIVTEFIGVSLALQYFHVSPYISVPIAGAVLIAITASGSFARWERAMFAFIAVSLILFPLALTSDPNWGQIGYHFVVPGIQGGVSSDAVLLIIAIVGTTVAPWQLFFQQSNVIDKRITPRFIGYERADTTLGALVVVIGAAAVLSHRRLRGHGALTWPGTSPTRSGWPTRSKRTADGTARRSPSSCSTRPSSARPPSPCRPATRSATCSASGTRCTARSPKPSRSTPATPP